MRAERPIISRPEAQSIIQRLTSGTLTILAWAVWIYLCFPLITVGAWLLGVHFTYGQLTAGPPINTVLFVILIAFLCSIIVASWASYNYIRFGKRSRRMSQKPISHSAIGKAFGVHDPETLSLLSQERRMNLYFDQTGLLIRVEALGVPVVEMAPMGDDLVTEMTPVESSV
jgi:biofilm PGA synthesis protein PgaD